MLNKKILERYIEATAYKKYYSMKTPLAKTNDEMEKFDFLWLEARIKQKTLFEILHNDINVSKKVLEQATSKGETEGLNRFYREDYKTCLKNMKNC